MSHRPPTSSIDLGPSISRIIFIWCINFWKFSSAILIIKHRRLFQRLQNNSQNSHSHSCIQYKYIFIDNFLFNFLLLIYFPKKKKINNIENEDQFGSRTAILAGNFMNPYLVIIHARAAVMKTHTIHIIYAKYFSNRW